MVYSGTFLVALGITVWIKE